MGPDEKSAVTKALWLGVNRSPFIPDFTKGGKFYIYALAASFGPYYLYLQITGQTNALAQQAGQSETFWEAPAALQRVFYDFLLVGRFLSVILGVSTLVLTYWFAKRQFGRREGLLASAFLAVSMGFVNSAHLATEDVLLAILLALVFVLLLEYEQTTRDSYLWTAALVSGLAVSTKLTAGFVVFPLVYAAIGGLPSDIRAGNPNAIVNSAYRILKCGLISLTAYLVTTPAVFVYPNLYFTELFNESAAAFGDQSALPGWVLQSFGMARAFGLPLFIICLVGLCYVVYRCSSGRGSRIEKTTLLFLIPYFVVIGSWQTSEVWYVIPLMPIFTVYGAYVVSRAYTEYSSQVVSVGIALVLLFSLVYTGATVHQISSDARIESTEWIEQNVPSGVTVDVYMYPLHLPTFPDSITVNRYWFQNDTGQQFEKASQRVKCGSPDYLVLSSAHYNKFLQNPEANPAGNQFYQDLLTGKTEYETVATFGPPSMDTGTLGDRLRYTIVPRTITNRDIRIVVLERQEDVTNPC